MIDYRYPSGGYWEAGSSKMKAVSLAKLIHELMNMRGVKVKSHYVGFLENKNLIGYDAKLDLGESVSIKFLADDAGATLRISLFHKDKDQDIFLTIWQNLTNAGYVFDDIFKREIKPKEGEQTTAVTQDKDAKDKLKTVPLKLPWEHMEGATDEEINLVRIWCTQKEKGKDLSNKTTYESPSNVLNRLRKKYPDANIPNGTLERKKFNEQYLKQNIDPKRVRSVKKID